MKSFIKENIIVVIAFSLPVLLIVGVGLSAYLPSLVLSTNYNFVYAACTDGRSYSYRCDDYLQQRHSVLNGSLYVQEVNGSQDLDQDSDEIYTSRLFLHNTKTNETREIPLVEAQTLNLDQLLTSPDGVTVSNEYNRGAGLFLFSGGSSYGHYLMKGNAKWKLNLINHQDSYNNRNNIQFIGWVLPGRN